MEAAAELSGDPPSAVLFTRAPPASPGPRAPAPPAPPAIVDRYYRNKELIIHDNWPAAPVCSRPWSWAWDRSVFTVGMWHWGTPAPLWRRLCGIEVAKSRALVAVGRGEGCELEGLVGHQVMSVMGWKIVATSRAASACGRG